VIKIKKAWVIGIFVWFAVIGIGFFQLMQYENTPARMLPSQTHWPSNSRLVMDQSKLTLLMFLHPECPCSRASLLELATAVRPFNDKVKVYLVFYQPSIFPDSWHEESGLWKSAHQLIPSASLFVDRDGKEAERFHSAVSGQTLLFDTHHQLLFNGGVTSGRGQEGDSKGKAALTQLLANQSHAFSVSQVFGCPILKSLIGS
jgi:hypothetical protein